MGGVLQVSDNILWTVFAAMLAIIGIIALRACTLSLPGVGVLIERCPSPAEPEIPLPAREANSLLAQYDALRAEIARAPACPAKPVIDLPPGIPEPPPLRSGGEVVFIVDTSSSMKSEGFDRTSRDILKGVFGNSAEELDLSIWGFGATCDASSEFIGDQSNPQIQQRINGIQFEFGNTTLLPAMMDIPKMLEPGFGREANKPAHVIFIADGDNSCVDDDVPRVMRGHPGLATQNPLCIGAKLIKNQLPYLQIHAVALTPKVESGMSCVTDETNGWMVPSANPASVEAAILAIVEAAQ